MDIEKLESFLTLARVQNFAKAADILFISQPALSKRIQSLENEMNAPLFNRMGGQTYLTIQGDYFKRIAEEMVATYNNAHEYIRQMENLEHGELRFGATNFIGVYLVPEILAQFQKVYPRVEISMTINTSRTILEMLGKNQLEFILLSDYILEDAQSYVVERYMVDELKLIVGNQHPLFGRDHCSVHEVEQDLYVTKNRKSSQYRFLEKQGIRFERQMFISNQEAIKECVVNNIGVSIMSSKMVEREVAAGLISTLTLDEFSLHRDIQWVCRKDRHITPAARAFLQLLTPNKLS